MYSELKNISNQLSFWYRMILFLFYNQSNTFQLNILEIRFLKYSEHKNQLNTAFFFAPKKVGGKTWSEYYVSHMMA